MSSANSAVFAGLMNETYQSVERMIWRIVNSYHKKHGGDLEELKSVANLAFTEAVYSWNESKGKFTTHVWTQIKFALMNEATSLYKGGGFVKERTGPFQKDDSSLLDQEDHKIDLNRLAARQRFDLGGFLANLSEEAKKLAQIAVVLSSEDKRVTEHKLAEICEEAGWAGAEFLRAFKEIGEALT